MNWTVPCDKVDINLLINSPMTFFIQIFVGLSGAIVVIGICELIYKFFGKKRIAENILSKLSIIGRYICRSDFYYRAFCYKVYKVK